MDALQGLLLFGVTPALPAIGVLTVFLLLRHSAPAKDLVLAILTDPLRTPAAQLREQYLNYRSMILGQRFLSRRRLLVSSGLVACWIVILAIMHFATPDLFIGWFAGEYFSFLAEHTLAGISLIAVSVLAIFLITSAFDVVLSMFLFRTSSIVINFLLLALTTYLGLVLAISVCFVCAEIHFHVANNESAMTSADLASITSTAVRRAAARLGYIINPFHLQELYAAFTASFLQPFSTEAAMGNGMMKGVYVAMMETALTATVPMLSSCILLLSVFNFAYNIGMLLAATDLFLRHRYGFDPTKIYNDPVGYLGIVSAAVAFALAASFNMVIFVFR